MNYIIKKFCIQLLVGISITFSLHILVLQLLDKPLFNDHIVLAYCINVLLAAIIFGTLYVLRKKYKNEIGFLFMGGSFLKFIVFFIVFYPLYKADGDIKRVEFAAFFIPYAVSLIVETLGIKRFLLD